MQMIKWLLHADSSVHNLDGSTGSASREYRCIKGVGKADSRNRVARECTEYCMWHSRPSFAEEKVAYSVGSIVIRHSLEIYPSRVRLRLWASSARIYGVPTIHPCLYVYLYQRYTKNTNVVKSRHLPEQFNISFGNRISPL